MTQATKTLATLFIVLAAATGLHFAFGGKSSSEAFSSSVVSFDSTSVNRMLIERPGKPAVELKRDGKIWNVVYEDGKSYPADRSTVMSAMNDLLSMKVKSMATRDPEKFSRFLVDSTGTTVRLLNGTDEKAAVVVGKFNFVSRSEFNTYVRNAAKNDVFAVEGFLNSTFNREPDSWRDKNVWKLDEKQIRQVELQFPGDSSWAAFRASSSAWLSVSDTLDASKADNLARQVASISASQFDDAIQPADVLPSYIVKVTLDNGTSKELKLVQHPDDGAYYRGVASDYPYVFRLSRSTWDGTVLKGRSYFLKN